MEYIDINKKVPTKNQKGYEIKTNKGIEYEAEYDKGIFYKLPMNTQIGWKNPFGDEYEVVTHWRYAQT
tara:strand:- start:5834 stop:6037 length:204 start_codon:yes stop_codon:yes gene_type:complete